jgi:hypothetical protein
MGAVAASLSPKRYQQELGKSSLRKLYTGEFYEQNKLAGTLSRIGDLHLAMQNYG